MLPPDLGIDVEAVKRSSYHLLEHSEKISNIILKSSSPNLDVVPSDIDLVAIELELVNHPNREFMLKEALREVKDKYDYIIIDCAPFIRI